MAVLAENDAWIADPSDPDYPDAPTVKLIDFQAGCNGTSGWFLFPDPDFGVDPLTVSDTNVYGRDGDSRLGHNRADRVISFTLGYKLDESIDEEEAVQQALEDLDVLRTALDRPGMFVFQLRGLEEPVYFDYKESPLPEIFRGGPNVLPDFFGAKAAPQGLDIVLTVYPWARWARTEMDVVTVDNAVGNRGFLMTSPGNRPSEFRLEATPDGGFVGGLEFGFRTEGNLSEWLATYSRDATTWEEHEDTTIVGDVAHCDFGDETMEWRFRDPRTWTDPTAMEGRHNVKLRLQLTDATESTGFRVQARWGFSGDDYAQEPGEVITLDATDLDTPNWVELNVAEIVVPKGATRLDIDIYAERIEGDGELDFQQILLVPASVWNFGAYVPGLRHGEWGHERWDASELVGTGELKFGQYRLNANAEYARPAPLGSTGGGRAYPAGIHAFNFIGSVREPTTVATHVGVFGVYQSSDGAVRKYISLRSKKGRLRSFFGRRPRRRRRFFATITDADVTGGEKFFPKVVFSAATLAGRRIDIEGIRHSFLRTATDETPLVVDTFQRRSFVRDGDGVTLFPLVPENEWPLLPAGDFGMVVSVYDAPPDPGYEDFDEREALAISNEGRAADLAISVWPRRFGLG